MTEDKFLCPICSGAAGRDTFKDCRTEEGPAIHVDCLRCGEFFVTHRAITALVDLKRLGRLTPRVVANLAGWTRELPKDPAAILKRAGVELCGAMRAPSFQERADKFLSAIEDRTPHAGARVSISPELFGCSWAVNEDELAEITEYLHENKHVEWSGEVPFMASSVVIKPAGWARLETLKAANPDSSQGFIAMWFNDEEVGEAHRAIREAVESSGYKPQRVDNIEHEGRIDDRIIAEIRRSRFVVADHTGHRGGVYYEAGFAHGLGLKVFFTCRKDDLDDLHFDTRQYNCIDWESPEDLKNRLALRIEAVLGRGPHAS